ncbi:hypothetical protein Acor_21870 [Acrocarpospora corrugata]|uniref:Uncharacterized protein n=1 Tax=Acrocarpospora corrugata TaxID=35763 RepID=A0A5M3VUC4_9ACTN|nr:hypothetical protein [Acrocarpospora corrugata]GES00124.1 hypothetical protein Acor_21870 [Acrocarpospora corrugata]
MTRWLTRDDLAAAARTATGLLMVSADGVSVRPSPAGTATADALRSAGVGPRDRVVIALAEPYGGVWASAAAGVAEAAASVGPRGRMRLQHLVRTLGATTLVITPTGAMDLLSRLHLEFLLDPLDLGLRRVVLTGEIASAHTMAHLTSEFEAEVSEVLASPCHGGALGWRSSESAPLTPLAEIALASLDKDAPVETGLAEITEISGNGGVRTGLVGRVGTPGETPAPAHTVGDHVLVRGVWLSLPRIEKALAKIDGVATWDLTVTRQGTLDAATLTVTFTRQSLIKNPMWQSRLRDALRALTPITLTVQVSPEIAESPRPGTLTDLRGHHLGRDRTTIAH